MKYVLILLSPITIPLALCFGVLVGLYMWACIHHQLVTDRKPIKEPSRPAPIPYKQDRRLPS